MRRGHYIKAGKLGGYSGCILESWDIPSFRAHLQEYLTAHQDFPEPFAKYPGRAIYSLKSDFGKIYIKHYCIRSIKMMIQTFFHLHKAQKSWRIAQILLARGILTPQPISLMNRWTSWHSREYILITEGIADSVSLRECGKLLLSEQEKMFPSTFYNQGINRIMLKRKLIRSVAEFLANLHLAGIYHGDLTANNILLECQNEQWCVYLIDLDSVRSTRRISDRRRIKNLDELGRNFLDLKMLSTSDRVRFLKYYLNIYTGETRTFHELFYEILNRTRFRLHKHQQMFIR
ncbi:MAG: hypothetical protein JXB60_08045 [Candidatus Cloacimonetes bacterium]|nr:hypothetical protein [Candidatus Cloacimonadota bacterium]